MKKKPKTQFEKGFDEALQACGGCTLCYGKGYSSTLKGYESSLHERIPYLAPQISFCSCVRGQSLRDILERRFEITN